MPKSYRKGSAFDKPGPSWQYKQDMRQAGAVRAALAGESKADEEKAILAHVWTSTLAAATKKRFLSDVRGALRRVKDGQGSTPCTNWARGCDKCRSSRVGDAHHIFCENRGDWKTKPEKDLALKLKREIESYHKKFWREDATSGELAAPAAATLAITSITTAAVAPTEPAAPAAALAISSITTAAVAPEVVAPSAATCITTVAPPEVVAPSVQCNCLRRARRLYCRLACSPPRSHKRLTFDSSNLGTCTSTSSATLVPSASAALLPALQARIDIDIDIDMDIYIYIWMTGEQLTCIVEGACVEGAHVVSEGDGEGGGEGEV
jgi:hypothetical protein